MKYQRFTPSGGKNIGISKSEFVTKVQFLWVLNIHLSLKTRIGEGLYCFVFRDQKSKGDEDKKLTELLERLDLSRLYLS